MRAAALLGAALALAGCGMQPMPYPPSPGELGTRPGLLSGQTGEITFCCHADPAPVPAATPAKPSQ
ncbi:MAG TPA: hypothetical protein VMB81_18655 [Candidatus Sulfotelmatobacter sp.]|nr:hypothetical protein [Candidatus Sulfotelmatobacter sp.]